MKKAVHHIASQPVSRNTTSLNHSIDEINDDEKVGTMLAHEASKKGGILLRPPAQVITHTVSKYGSLIRDPMVSSIQKTRK